MDWIETNSYLKGLSNSLKELHDPVRIASFDLDDTIIHRKKGEVGGKWQLIDKDIGQKIADLVKDKFVIILFTNQSSMGSKVGFDKPSWRKAVDDLMKEMTMNVKSGKFYFAVYVAKMYDLYRKPNIGMWQLMKLDLMKEFGLDAIRVSKKSFFCGDAAGRESPGPIKKKLSATSKTGDFSDTDRKFALNIGINFLTPEDFYFDNSPQEKYKLAGINPVEFIAALGTTKDRDRGTDDAYVFVPRKKEMIVMIGPPGSGKSEFVKNNVLVHGYVHINQDTCKTKAKCLAETKKALEEKKSVVIDNTNPDVLTRMAYTQLAKNSGYKNIRAIIINIDSMIAKHLNNVRHVYSNGLIPNVNGIAYHVYKKKYVKPQTCEYFDKIETVDFIFDTSHLEDPTWKKIFLRWSEA